MVDNGKELLDLWKTKLQALNCREEFFDQLELLWREQRNYAVTVNAIETFLDSEYGCKIKKKIKK